MFNHLALLGAVLPGPVLQILPDLRVVDHHVVADNRGGLLRPLRVLDNSPRLDPQPLLALR